jgi:UDP-N-acetylglucosamine 2-epimerase
LSIAEVNIGKKAANEIILQQLASSIILGDQSGIKKEVNHALHAGIPACNILNKGMIQGMTVLGRMFRDNEVYVPQVIMASQAMEAGLKILKPFLSEFHLSYKGKVVIGTIQYDIHDLGKNIVGIFLESSGFKVLDLGVDVPTESFVQAVEKERPDLLAICAMMTTTLPYMQEVVEAGPRMHDKKIPEEVNRVVTDHISSMLFAPTPLCLDNLHREGLTKGVHLTGDVMLDCFLHFSKEAERRIRILDELDIKQGSYLLTTVHRASNTDTKTNLQEICKAFIKLAKEIELIFPVHPRTEKYLKQYDLYQTLADTPNIHLIKPVGYLEMLILTKNAKKILTDSGGLQKEAYFAKVPCITLDTVSAWPETVEDGWNMVVGEEINHQQITSENIIHAARTFEPNKKQLNIFGDGKAAENICDLLVNHNLTSQTSLIRERFHS